MLVHKWFPRTTSVIVWTSAEKSVGYKSMKSIFKFLCLSFLISILIDIVLSFFRYYFIGEEYAVLLEYDRVGYLLPIYMIWPVFIFSIFTSIVPLYSLYRGSRFALKIFIFGFVFSLLISLFSGVRVSIPVESFIGGIIYFLWGGTIVAAIYNLNIISQEVSLSKKIDK